MKGAIYETTIRQEEKDMILRRNNFIKELPVSCTTCPLYPMECSLALENEYLKDGLDARRDDACSLVELKESDINYFLSHTIKNRDNSQALSEMPEQHWKEAHRSEVVQMNGIIGRLENMKKVLESSWAMIEDKKAKERLYDYL
jgi:hypothetical protein